MTVRYLILAASVWAVTIGCEAYAVDNKAEFERPPYAGTYEPIGVDERGLWMEVDEGERRLRDSPGVIRDEVLTAYIRGILCKTVGFDRCNATRIYIVRDSTFNASMAPNGLMIVHTGLLARIHSEAELATVLAHEFAHFELRHTLQQFRKLRRGTDVLAWLGLSGAALNQDVSAMQNSIVAGIISFGRNHEKEADLLAAAYVRSSPYPLRASVVWQRLLNEDNARRDERKLRKVNRYQPSVTDTHPTDLQRISYFSALEAEVGAQSGDDAMENYRDQTARLMPELFDSLVKGNDFAGTDYIVRTRGDAMGWDGLMLFTRGELYRLRGNPRDIETARTFFQKATTLPGAPPEAWRGLGLSALRLGETTEGKLALRGYLERLPTARDASSINLLLGD